MKRRRRRKNYAYPKYILEITFPSIPAVEAAFMRAIIEELPSKTGVVDDIKIVRIKDRETAYLKMHTITPRRIRDLITKALDMLAALGEIEAWYPEYVEIEAK